MSYLKRSYEKLRLSGMSLDYSKERQCPNLECVEGDLHRAIIFMWI